MRCTSLIDFLRVCLGPQWSRQLRDITAPQNPSQWLPPRCRFVDEKTGHRSRALEISAFTPTVWARPGNKYGQVFRGSLQVRCCCSLAIHTVDGGCQVSGLGLGLGPGAGARVFSRVMQWQWRSRSAWWQADLSHAWASIAS